MKNYKYEANVCNNIIYDSLIKLRASGVDDEDIPLMLDCIGKAFVKMSIENKPVEYYIRHLENADMKGGAE